MPASPLLALRFAGQDHALEVGRDYLLGSGPACDLRLPATAEALHARLEVDGDGARIVDQGSAAGTWHNGDRVTAASLAAGDVLRFGDAAEAIVVSDDGSAVIVPIPAMRAAARTRRSLVTARDAAAALRHGREQTFEQLVAAELRRAPWLAASLLLHALLLLLAWILLPRHAERAPLRAEVAIDWNDAGAKLAAAAPAPDVDVEEAHEAPAPSAAPEPAIVDEPAAVDDGARADESALPTGSLRMRLGTARANSTPSGGTGADLAETGSGDFRQTVGELRKSGLEIVFVFDSTGSMSATIRDTKQTITQMLAVLRTLVPDARVGLVTYRDKGRSEDYVVRSVPLDVDFWRAANFVQFVTAEGGGDLPEAVRAGLDAAFAQKWRSGARRVVVLAGDAPPHAADRERMLSEVRAFARNGRSFVHTLLTVQEGFGDADGGAFEAFQAIAAAGKGTCQRLASGDRVLQRVLTLAFGREFDQDVASVIRTVEHEARRVDVQALDLARRGGPELVRALRQDPVPQGLWNALVKRPRRATVEQLVAMFGDAATPAHTRQALAAALQAIFELSVPPIDPVDADAEAEGKDLARLRTLAARLPE